MEKKEILKRLDSVRMYSEDNWEFLMEHEVYAVDVNSLFEKSIEGRDLDKVQYRVERVNFEDRLGENPSLIKIDGDYYVKEQVVTVCKSL